MYSNYLKVTFPFSPIYLNFSFSFIKNFEGLQILQRDGKVHFVVNTFGAASLFYRGSEVPRTNDVTLMGMAMATQDLKFGVTLMSGNLLDITAQMHHLFDVVIENNGTRVCTIHVRQEEFEIETNYFAQKNSVEQSFAEFTLCLHGSNMIRCVDIKNGRNASTLVFLYNDVVLEARRNGNKLATKSYY